MENLKWLSAKKKKNYVNTFVSKKWMQNTKHYLPVELCGPQFLIQSGPISLSHLFLSITICVCVCSPAQSPTPNPTTASSN